MAKAKRLRLLVVTRRTELERSIRLALDHRTPVLTTAQTIDDAIEQAKEVPFDVIVLENQMAGGTDLSLREGEVRVLNWLLPRARIIVIDGTDAVRRLSENHGLVLSDTIAQPVSQDRLQICLAKAFAR